MLGGRDLTKLRGQALREARREIGMVFQEYNLVERLSVIENLLCGRLGYTPLWRVWTRRYPESDIERAFALLDRVGLGDFATRRADALSGDSAAGRHSTGGDAGAQAPARGRADIVARPPDLGRDHDADARSRRRAGHPRHHQHPRRGLAKRFATRIIGMSAGTVVFDGPPADLADDHLHLIYGAGDATEGWIG